MYRLSSVWLLFVSDRHADTLNGTAGLDKITFFLPLLNLHFFDFAGKHSQIIESDFQFELERFNAVAQIFQRIAFSFGSYRGDHLHRGRSDSLNVFHSM